MMLTFSWVAVVVIVITSVGLLLARDWRSSIILLAVQYVAMFTLCLSHMPLGMASVKVVSGWMSAATLGMTRSSLSTPDIDEENNWPRGISFRLFAAGMVGIIVAGAAPRVNLMMADAGTAVTTGSLLLIGMGLLHLGLTANILRVTISLMTILSGFEILYAAVEGSVLVTALLATIILGLALVGAYLMLAANAEETEETESV
ncbi:MAG: hypothetical protein HXY35_04710 [Chloroflexi bacterium]|nr:hypothetical protein [Chloroflexota bacterium]